jgi:hypothetical protein
LRIQADHQEQLAEAAKIKPGAGGNEELLDLHELVGEDEISAAKRAANGGRAEDEEEEGAEGGEGGATAKKPYRFGDLLLRPAARAGASLVKGGVGMGVGVVKSVGGAGVGTVKGVVKGVTGVGVAVVDTGMSAVSGTVY